MIILGIESSCDDTGAAVLDDGRILSTCLTGQEEIHTRFGGVVPELASRSHLQSIHPVVTKVLEDAEKKLDDIDLIAVTQGPGLVGSLLVGFSYARSLAHIKNIPLVGVDHMAGHILSIFLDDDPPAFPYIALIVSGGTSSIFLAESFTRFKLLGRTRDDAAGEAFDKVAKLLELPYPGGPHISRLAGQGDARHIDFPRAWLGEDSPDFSFSGLKTAVLNHVRTEKQKKNRLHLNHICASFQEAVVEVLVEKTIRTAGKYGICTVVAGGGVASNNRLREKFSRRCSEEGLQFKVPSPCYCTDNAAMIGFAGYHKFLQNGPIQPDQDVYSRTSLG
jgi:N6-L-threonylcarbamoyladenine synthase